MYYVIESQYVGPNQDQDQYIDYDRIEITTTPARTNMSTEIRLSGWCGTTSDVAVYAHGEYETIEAAQDAIEAEFGGAREDKDCLRSWDDDIIAVYRPGEYEPMGEEATGEYIYDSMQADITANTTDAQLAAIEEAYETDANLDGYTLTGARRLITDHRQDLIWEVEAAQ